MFSKYLPFAVAALPVYALLTGCAVGPDFHRPSPPTVSGYAREPLCAVTSSANVAGGEEQRFVVGMDIPKQWWKLFNSPELNALIERSIKANPTIDAAKAALRQARENASAQAGYFYPAVLAGGSVNRAKDSGAISPVPSSGSEPYTLHTAQVTVGFAPDVFGGNRRQVESLNAQAASQRFQLEAVYLALTSNVVAAAIQEASVRSQIASTLDIIKIQTELLGKLRQQLGLGYVAGLEVAAQEAVLAQVRQTLPPLNKQLAQTRNLLSALAGHFPSEEPEEKFELAALSLPQELPVSLPSKLVEQRPDIRAAEEQLHSASAQLGVAVAARLPQFTLGASWGSTAETLGQLFSPGTVFWNLVGNIAQPVFDGGILLHRKQAAEAGLDQAAAQYRGTLITAFQNVSDTLHALQSDADALKAAVTFEQATKRSLDLTRRQFELGQVSYLSLLSAEQAYQQAVINLVQAKANRFSDTAALFMALGGGWWNAGEVSSAQAVVAADKIK
jgi:NodT family efflux transporter outer membrane factor (OMF) lipoprotein